MYICMYVYMYICIYSKNKINICVYIYIYIADSLCYTVESNITLSISSSPTNFFKKLPTSKKLLLVTTSEIFSSL